MRYLLHVYGLAALLVRIATAAQPEPSYYQRVTTSVIRQIKSVNNWPQAVAMPEMLENIFDDFERCIKEIVRLSPFLPK
jgi:hypothetical protein